MIAWLMSLAQLDIVFEALPNVGATGVSQPIEVNMELSIHESMIDERCILP